MKKHEGPRLACRPVTCRDDQDWNAVRDAFRTADTVCLHQAWRASAQPACMPGTVRTGWCKRGLLVYADLEDTDIFNPVTTFNAPAFQHGDAFEIFLRPAAQHAYYEFHVSPRNQIFQLRIPSAAAFKALPPGTGIRTDWLVSGRRIASRVRTAAASGRWEVLARIPLDMVMALRPVTAGDEWRFSFSRYDYTRGIPDPVLSSSSPHRVLDFHRQQEWGRLRFEA